ncbi:glycosyltransferase [Lyngbya confervoides]|uniref:Glycosyltransferase n=1 Tax=Lyngbya confervoides BDU141951 TaxID=1574623 RepID=A0ABD4T5D8_9CYAN|nr:glycosyltransferase [Lyngbya confervoides]MCM1983737.1 glycosyltransferase [Lyngbya confervoides BDU141951]
MRKLLFLLPGTTKKFHCGGLFAEQKTLALAQQLCAAEVVTYRQREPDKPYLPDLLQQPHLDDVIFVVSWGFDVPKLVKKLTQYPVIYHAHSSEYGFRLPARIPIVTVSRNTLGYWGQRSPHTLLYYLPNEISPEFANLQCDREIDVLVHARKSSSYLLNQLIPALKPKVNVQVIDGFVDSLAELFNRSKVYLYDSAEYWAVQGVTEGFGLQPLEAMACGCQVFSSVNHGLSDYLDPGFNCQKIAGCSTAFDVQRILRTVQNYQPPSGIEPLLLEYRKDNILRRLGMILTELNEFFDHQRASSNDIAPLNLQRIVGLRLHTLVYKVKKKLLNP